MMYFWKQYYGLLLENDSSAKDIIQTYLKFLTKLDKQFEFRNSNSTKEGLNANVLSPLLKHGNGDVNVLQHFSSMAVQGKEHFMKTKGLIEEIAEINDSTVIYSTPSKLKTGLFQEAPGNGEQRPRHPQFNLGLGDVQNNIYNLMNTYVFTPSEDSELDNDNYVHYLKKKADSDNGYVCFPVVIGYFNYRHIYHTKLFEIYAKGDKKRGIPQNMELAKHYLEIASERGKLG